MFSMNKREYGHEVWHDEFIYVFRMRCLIAILLVYYLTFILLSGNLWAHFFVFVLCRLFNSVAVLCVFISCLMTNYDDDDDDDDNVLYNTGKSHHTTAENWEKIIKINELINQSINESYWKTRMIYLVF